ncbi:MAG TPA: DUF3052 family protein [Gemmatimonadaceae bacterium]|nr:DUF3052 family protein [Gemmatimonadaceae bacterium]
MKQAGYSGTPLLKKLGVKEGSRVAVIKPPAGFVDSLPELPFGATLSHRGRAKADVIVWFVMSSADLAGIASAIDRMPDGSGMLWAAWPKKASGVKTDLTEDVIRVAALRAGLVDTKVCAIDETWSGLRLSRRKSQPK